MSIFSINSKLTKLRCFPPNFQSPMKDKMFFYHRHPNISNHHLFLSIGLYCKCFQNGKSCVCKYTRLTSLPGDNTHIVLEPISNPLPESPDQLSSQIIQEILKAKGVDFLKLECYKRHKAKCHTVTQATKI